MKIGFTGTQRGMTDFQYLNVKLFIQKNSENISEAHHGDCVGADSEFHDIVQTYNLYTSIHPPINPSKRAFRKGNIIFPEKEYLDRNHDIVNSVDLMIATPGEETEILRSGTWATIRYAKKNNKPIVIIYPNRIEFFIERNK